MRKKGNKPDMRWMLLLCMLAALIMSVSPVAGFTVTVPNETLNRYFQVPDEMHLYALYSSDLGIQERENVDFFPGNYSYPDPFDAYFKKYNQTFPCYFLGRFSHIWDHGTFPIIITGKPGVTYSVGWVLCEEGMTGKVCDRPPWIMPNSTPTRDDGVASYPLVQFDDIDDQYPEQTVIGRNQIQPLEDCCMRNGMTFWEAVPNGDVYPSKGDWDVPYNGKRYYAEITADSCGFALLKFDMDQTIKEGTYKFHIQEKGYNPGQGGDYGYVNAFVHIQKGPVEGPQSITMPYADANIRIDGLNYDSKYTYLWIRGQNLPKCGVSLVDQTDPNPLVVNVSPKGKWEFSWDPTDLGIGEGSYEIYYSSVDPNDPNQRSCITCANSPMNGICALEDPKCAICGVFDLFPVTLTYPQINAKIEPVEVERCCCPGEPCGVIGGNEEIWVKGISEGDFTGEIKEKTLQVWLFGEGMIGDYPYLFTEFNYLCDGTFEYELNKNLLQEFNIGLCDLNPGKYYVVIQSPMFNEKFDVTLQDSDAYKKGITDGAIPVNEPGQKYVVTSTPVSWSKSFILSGINAKIGVEALQALKAAIDDPTIDDEYAIDELTGEVPYFIIKDNKCTKSVDFSGSPSTGYVPLNVQFNGDATFDVVEWSWDFGDGSISNEKDPVHVYIKPGIYTVKLVATYDEDGTIKKKENVKYSYIKVRSFAADFSFAPDPATTGEIVQFRDKSIGKPTSWLWDFGDGSISSVQSPNHVYYLPGTYNVTLTVSDEYGEIQVSKPVEVKGEPISTGLIADFTISPSTVYAGEPVQFTDKSKGGTPTSWMWSFGDGLASSLQSPVHTYEKPGTYQVILNVGDNRGVGVPKIADYVVMNDPPVAAFKADPISSEFYPVQVEFTDLSTGAIDEWNWQIKREGKTVATSSEQSPTITFTVPGIYTVTLTVKNNGGSDSATKDNYITIGTGSQFTVEQGWNHVSVPMAVTEDYNTVSKLFDGIQTGGVPYAVFNNAANEWVDVPNDYLVKPLEALRVWKEDPGSIVITPDYVKGGIFTRDLKTGWNGIGIMAMQPVPANVALASLGEAWNKTLMFNPLTQRWEYPIIRGVDDDKLMYPTVGYLIEMNSDGILIGGE